MCMMQKQRKKRMMEEDEVRSFPLILDWHDFYEPNGNDDVLVPRQMESGYMEKITLIERPLAYLYIKDTFFQLFYQFWKKPSTKLGVNLDWSVIPLSEIVLICVQFNTYLKNKNIETCTCNLSWFLMENQIKESHIDMCRRVVFSGSEFSSSSSS